MAEQPTLAELIVRHQSKCFNEQDRKLVQRLIDNDDTDELRRRMQPRITFGTSGLRAAVGPGFARMNDLAVYMATRGLALYLLDQVPDARERGVVVGHDHRHGSASFARITRQTLAHEGFKVYTFDRLVHTPLVPYAVRRLRACAGVMLTASHNPKQDNGYKVYWENACAIIPPHDAGISAQIDACAQTDPPEPQLKDEPGQQVFDEIYPQYLHDVLQLVQPSDGSGSGADSTKTCAGVRVAYTPMHGVGLPFARDVASRLGATLVKVAQQAAPDPDFPTVKFPNPEELGALSVAQSVAEEAQCTVVVANDPDADRFCFAERQSDGRWRQFTGNEIGCLLAETAVARTASMRDKRACLSSAVSSRALQSLCRAHGVHWEETLTGFKWLGNRALSLLEENDHAVVFAYEEAIGYMPGPPAVYDKDGVATLALFLTLLARLAAEGTTLADQLARFYGRYGSFASRNGYFRIAEPERMRQVMAQLRAPYKASLALPVDHFHGDGGQSGSTASAAASASAAVGESTDQEREVRVSRVRDLTKGFDSATDDERPTLPTDAASEMITYWFDLSATAPAAHSGEDGSEGARVGDDRSGGAEGEWATMTVRGSGTEPKLKYYIECATSASVADAQRTADRIEAALCQDWLRDFDLDRVS